jgi:hypothetical protein
MSILIIFYPFLNPINTPGTNPDIAVIGSPDAATADGCGANCVAVLLSARTIQFCDNSFLIHHKGAPLY